MIDDSLGDEVRVTVIAAGFEAGAAGRKPVVSPGATPGTPGATQPIAPGKAGKVSSPLFEPSDAASVPPHSNGATVRVGGGDGPDDGGIADDDVDVPPFMRH